MTYFIFVHHLSNIMDTFLSLGEKNIPVCHVQRQEAAPGTEERHNVEQLFEGWSESTC